MLRRRVRKSRFALVRETLWPRTGWRRAGSYIWHRLHRLPGTPHSIAAGVACGCAFSVTPLVGIHFFLAAIFAWLIRANVITSTFGTIIGNPWTFPFIWLTIYHLGRVMMGLGLSLDAELDFTGMFMGLMQSMIEADGVLFMEQVWPIWLPMFVGCVPVSILTWLLVYAVFFRLTDSYQRRRAAKRGARGVQSVNQMTSKKLTS